MIGKSLVHYEISAEIGRGGMGEVYQAKDTKLGREVAIKVLPEEFALDTDRVARFQREAKLLASLNHPNIAAIYGLEESEGTHFLVMELIEGDTLRDRIKSGPIPVEEALKLALQMAEALEAAHEKGVIHRDLKPANIKITPEGKIKILDFGLAKAYSGEQGNVSLADSPTISAAATQQGVILGTAAYMSPEQARGKPVDRRADIWAFGVVLYEMLMGKAAFSGDDVTDTLAAVIRSEPEWKGLPANLHWRVKEVLERCLEKKAKDRCGSINDARVGIQKVLADPSGVIVQPIAGFEPHKRTGTTLTWVAVIILVAILAGVAVLVLKPTEPRQVMRFDYDLPEDQRLNGWRCLAASSDGKKFVYATNQGLYLRYVDELTAIIIKGTETDSPEEPFFSPDDKWIGYVSVADQKLKKIALVGGTPASLCDVSELGGASWSANDTIVYGTGSKGAIMRVSAQGGNPEAIVKSESDVLERPQILPDGKSFLYNKGLTGYTDYRVMAQSFESGEARELIAGYGIQYIPTGHILYWPNDSDNLLAVSFDPDKLEITGDPVLVAEKVGAVSVSDTGNLIYTAWDPTGSGNLTHLVWMDRDGKEEPLGTPPNTYISPKVSPDGKWVAVSIGSFPDLDIWIWDITRKNLSKLTFEKTREMNAIWSPDGKRIVYWSDTSTTTPWGVHLKSADGTGEAEKLFSPQEDRQLFPFSWSRDGKTLLLQEQVTWTNMNVCILSMEGDHVIKPLLQTEHTECQPQISPDGRWFAYSSDETTGELQKSEVYVRPFPDVNKGKWQISTSGGNTPLWSPDGRELFYLSLDNDVMTVAMEAEPSPRFGTPERLFKNTNLGVTFESGTPWDIHPDGSRFLMMKPYSPTGATEDSQKKITIVTNWFEELREKVPVD